MRQLRTVGCTEIIEEKASGTGSSGAVSIRRS